MMDQVRYRVKLYGHKAADPDAFCVELAGIIGWSVDRTRRMLTAVPVILATGLQREAAEGYAELLRSKDGLCMVETTDGRPLSVAPEAPSEKTAPLPEPSAAPEAPDMPKAPEPIAKPLGRPMGDDWESDPEDERRSRLWFGALVGIGSIFVLLVVTAFLSNLWSVYRQSRTVVVPPQTTWDSATEVSDALDRIVEQTEEIKKTLTDLRGRITEQQAAVAVLSGSTGPRKDKMFEEEMRLVGMRNQFADEERKLRLLQKEMDLIRERAAEIGKKPEESLPAPSAARHGEQR